MLSETECFHLHSYLVETINVFDQYIGFQETFFKNIMFYGFYFSVYEERYIFLSTVYLSAASMACFIKEFTRS